MSTDLETLAVPDSPEGVGTTLHYLLAALLGMAVASTEWWALLREGGWL